MTRANGTQSVHRSLIRLRKPGILCVMQSGGEQSTEEIEEIVRAIKERGEVVRVIGGETQAHIGHAPTRSCTRLSTLGLNKIVEYTPEDLVVVAQAGVRFRDLQSALAEHRQWLPLEPALPEQQTLGGLVATRTHSALRAGYGSTRDWLIGLEVVDARGQRVRGGGKVVKNVSGYDLPRLYCGSWGTLGVITEVAFKIAPLPEAQAALLVLLAVDRNSEDALDALLAQEQPTAAHLFNAEAAKALLGPDAVAAQYLFVRYQGADEAVAAQIKRAGTTLAPSALSTLILPPSVAENIGAVVRDFSAQNASLSVRFNILSSQVGAYVRMIEWTANRANLTARVLADAVTGVIYAQYEPNALGLDWQTFYADFKDKADRVGGSMVIERMPVAWQEDGIAVWSPELPDWALMRRMKTLLDPDRLFSPGTFVGGI